MNMKIVIIICSILLLMGCSQQRGEERVKEIVFLNWETLSAGRAFIENAIREFEGNNPGIRVRNLQVNSQHYQNKLLTMIAADTPPDIFETGIFYMNELLRKNVCLNIQPFLDSDPELSERDFFQEPLSIYKYNGIKVGEGPLYGLPKDWSVVCILFFNKDLFDAAGLEYPNKSLTWIEFLELAKKLTIRDEEGRLIQAGAVIGGYQYYLCFVQQNGGKIWSDDYKTCLLDSPEAIEAFEFFHNLLKKYKVTPTSAESESINPGQMIFMGKVAMWFHARWFVPVMEKEIGNRFRWGFAPFIHSPGKPRLNIVGGASGWAISRDTRYPNETYKFLKFLAGERGQVLTAEAGWNIPTMKKIAYSDHFLGNPKHPDGLNKVFLDEVEYSIPEIMSPYIEYTRFYKILGDEMDLASMGNKEIAQAIRDAVVKINREISLHVK